MVKKETKNNELNNNINEYIKHIGFKYDMIFKIIMLYKELTPVNTFILDLQLYNRSKYNREFKARIWLTSNDYNGLKLQLYSFNLSEKIGAITKEDALKIFNEFINHYALHEDDLTNGKYIKLNFEVSNR